MQIIQLLYLIIIFNTQHKDIKVTLTQNPKSKPDPNNLVFGKYFSDHMLTINWTSENGWEKPRIIPFENLSLAPATSCLHYATEVNENMIELMDKWRDE